MSVVTHLAGDLTSQVQEPRRIAPVVWWLPACLSAKIDGEENHIHNSPYLLLGTERSLIFDTGHSASWRATEAQLDALLGDRGLDFVVPSHPEAPHCGNVHRLMEKYPDAVLLGDTRDYHLMFPEYEGRLEPCEMGTVIPLGDGETFVFLTALLRDLPSTQWGYNPRGRVMFTADAFAYAHYPPVENEDRPVHVPGECSMFASEFGYRPKANQITWIVTAAFYWARLTRMSKHRAPFEELLTEFPTDLIAPAHGALIDDLGLLPVIWEALEAAYDPSLESPLPRLSITNSEPASSASTPAATKASQ